MLLDQRFLDKPGFAIEQCKCVSMDMARLSKKSILSAISLFNNYDDKIRQEVVDIENIVDKYEDELGTYMVRLSSRGRTFRGGYRRTECGIKEAPY